MFFFPLLINNLLIALNKCVYLFELISYVSDVVHGTLVWVIRWCRFIFLCLHSPPNLIKVKSLIHLKIRCRKKSNTTNLPSVRVLSQSEDSLCLLKWNQIQLCNSWGLSNICFMFVYSKFVWFFCVEKHKYIAL